MIIKDPKLLKTIKKIKGNLHLLLFQIDIYVVSILGGLGNIIII